MIDRKISRKAVWDPSPASVRLGSRFPRLCKNAVDQKLVAFTNLNTPSRNAKHNVFLMECDIAPCIRPARLICN
jgi:hypothetical protein